MESKLRKTPEQLGLKRINWKDILALPIIEEDSVYLVHVASTSTNPIHEAIMFVGFKSGTYCMVSHHTYDGNFNLSHFYFIELVKKLHTLIR